MQGADEARERLSGLFNIVVTPFDRHGDLDAQALAENIERVIALGFDGCLIGGTYGEFPVMTAAERAELFRKGVEAVAGRVPVMLCSADADTRTARELTELASDLGGVPMVTAPFVSEVTDGQIVDYFHSITPLSRRGIVIYNAPGIGITLSPQLIERLADIPGIVALKQGDLSPTTVDTLIGRVGGRLRLFCASDLAFLGPVAAGFDGLSSTHSGAIPELIQATYRAIKSGELPTAGALHRTWYPLRALARRYGQPQTTKAAMAARGYRGGFVRPPLRDLDEAARHEVAAAIAEITESPLFAEVSSVPSSGG
jgi:dihydrodipicolinate synthase/N-acetylneuraminate lyase